MGLHNRKLGATDATSENKRVKKKRAPSDSDVASPRNHVASGMQNHLVKFVFFALCCFCCHSWIKALQSLWFQDSIYRLSIHLSSKWILGVSLIGDGKSKALDTILGECL